MAVTFELSAEYSFPNITVYNRYADGIPAGWRINANEGYVFHDTTENLTEPKIDPETGDLATDVEGNIIEMPVTYCFAEAYLPRNYNMANLTFVAVPRDSVDENYIFDGDRSSEEFAEITEAECEEIV